MYFGTYGRSLATVFQVIYSHYTVMRFMMENMSELWAIFFTIYFLVMSVAVLGVVQGVFTQETFQAAEEDDTLMLRRKNVQHEVHKRKMMFLFEKMTRSTCPADDDLIDEAQFETFLRKHTDFQTWLHAMDIDTSDASLLFELIDEEGNGELTFEEFIEGMGALRGNARNVDVKLLLRQSFVGRRRQTMGRMLSAAGALKALNANPEYEPLS